MYNNNRTKRNKLSKRILFIIIGFLAVFMFIGFYYQNYVANATSNHDNEHSLLFKIEDTTGRLVGKQFEVFLHDSLVYSDTLKFGSQEFLYETPCLEPEQLITLHFSNINVGASERINISDTGTTYLLLNVANSKEFQLNLKTFTF